MTDYTLTREEALAVSNYLHQLENVHRTSLRWLGNNYGVEYEISLGGTRYISHISRSVPLDEHPVLEDA